MESRSRATYVVMTLALSGVILLIDYWTGPLIEFEAMFVVPIAIAVWFTGRTWGLLLAGVLPLCRLYYAMTQGPPWTLTQATINATIRIVVLGGFAFAADHVRRSLSLARENAILRGMLPICSECKRINNGSGRWDSFEQYVSEHSGANVSRAVCPACAARYGQTYDRR
jgi:hypothetical protein